MKKALIILFSLLAFGIALISFIIFTQPGLWLLVKLSQRALHKYHVILSAPQVHGTLGAFTIDQFQIQYPTFSVIFDHTQGRLDVLLLLTGQLDVRQLNTDQITLDMPSDHVHKLIGHATGTLSFIAQQWRFNVTLTQNAFSHVQLKGYMAYQAPYPFEIKTQGMLTLENHSLSENIQASGTLSQYAFQGHVNLKALDNDWLTLDLLGTGTPNGIMLKTLNGQIYQGQVTGNAWAQWSPTLLWQGHFQERGALEVTLDTHQSETTRAFSLALKKADWFFNLVELGQKHSDAWQDQLTQLSIGSHIGRWQINTPSTLILQNTQLSLSNTCLSHNTESLCIAGDWTPSQWQAAINSTPIELANVPTPLSGLQLSGLLHLNVGLSQKKPDSVAGQMIVKLNNLKMTPSQQLSYRLDTHPLQIEQGLWNTLFINNALHSTLSLALAPNNTIAGEASIAPLKTLWPDNQTQLQGKLTVAIQNLSLLNELLPQLSNLSGQMHGILQVNSPLDNPLYTGELALSEVSAGMPDLGIEISKGILTLKSFSQGQFTLQGQFTSGQGNLMIQGRWYTGHNLSPDTFSITGKSVTLIHLPALQVVASPTLTYVENAQEKKLTGSILVNDASINADKLPKQSTLSPDVVFINNTENRTPALSNKKLYSQLRVEIPTPISFKGFGIDAQIGGTLNITSKPQQAVIVNGTLTSTKGTYSAYGKIFNIVKGRVIFNNSPLENPGLDVTALYNLNIQNTATSAALNTLEVGVHVYGTVAHPQLDLFSNPSMSQEDILSYIVLGVPLTQAQPSDSGSLSAAAFSFALSGGSSTVFSKVQSSLGLNQLSVGTLDSTTLPGTLPSPANNAQAKSNTAVFIGKSITSKLSVSYGVGLFNAMQEIRARYQLSSHWQVQTNASNIGSGADLIYTIDR